MRRFVVKLTVFLCLWTCHDAVAMSFDDWYEEFRRDAVEQGVRVSALDIAFQDVQMLDSVILADRKQPEFRKDLKSYIRRPE